MMIRKIITPLAFLLLCVEAFAADEFRQFGIIDSVDLKKSAVVIDDTYYAMALDMKVYDRRGDKTNRYIFKVGQKVHFTVKSVRAGVQQLDRVWILPVSAVRPVEDDYY